MGSHFHFTFGVSSAFSVSSLFDRSSSGCLHLCRINRRSSHMKSLEIISKELLTHFPMQSSNTAKKLKEHVLNCRWHSPNRTDTHFSVSMTQAHLHLPGKKPPHPT